MYAVSNANPMMHMSVYNTFRRFKDSRKKKAAEKKNAKSRPQAKKVPSAITVTSEVSTCWLTNTKKKKLLASILVHVVSTQVWMKPRIASALQKVRTGWIWCQRELHEFQDDVKTWSMESNSTQGTKRVE